MKTWWRDFWASEAGARLPPTAHPAVWRLFGWYQRRETLQDLVDAPAPPAPCPHCGEAIPGRGPELIVKGSTGQPKVTPLLAELRAIDAQIEALEKRIFGAAPAAADPEASSDPGALLDAANRRFAELVAERPDDADDLRLELVEGGAAGAA